MICGHCGINSSRASWRHSTVAWTWIPTIVTDMFVDYTALQPDELVENLEARGYLRAALRTSMIGCDYHRRLLPRGKDRRRTRPAVRRDALAHLAAARSRHRHHPARHRGRSTTGCPKVGPRVGLPSGRPLRLGHRPARRLAHPPGRSRGTPSGPSRSRRRPAQPAASAQPVVRGTDRLSGGAAGDE